jgi:PKD repeat protein
LYNISDSSCRSDTVSKLITINALPVSSFGFTHTGCRLDTIYLTGAGAAPGYTISNWKWNFSNGDSSLLQNPRVLLPVGNHTIKLRVTTPEGCFDDTIQAITVFATPTAGLTGSPLNLCEPGTVNFTDASTYSGSGAFTGSYWSFGDGQTVNNTNNNPVSNLYPVYGTYTVKHVVKVSDLCISDTATQTVRVYAKPRVNFTYPVGCLPLSNIAQFTNATTIPDGQTLSYNWNFGDSANSTVGNPNTSTAQSPTHQYNAYGQYLIKLSVSTPNGCVSDTTIPVTFNIRPTLAFAPLSNTCINVSSVSVARGSVTNSVPGTGIYRGPGTDTAGNFTPSVAGAGTQTIWFIFTSAAGCKDSVSQTIKVNPKPSADFSLSNAAFCANVSTTLTPQANVSSGSIASYWWSFGDGNNITYQNNTPFSRRYAAGNYNIRLVAVSDSGCVSDTIVKSITVNAVPVADFDIPASICMPEGKAQFTNRSTFGNGATIPNYTSNWSFGDLASSTDKDPLHIYTATGPYTVVLQVTSAEGCIDDTSKILSTFYDQPRHSLPRHIQCI